MVVSHRLGAPACRKRKSPSTGVADWAGRPGLRVRALVSNWTLASPLGGTSQASDHTRLNVGGRLI